jgi:flavin-dependent dehydrogenase
MKSRYIKIAGAGPAGLTAAINLAKSGYKVGIFEKNNNAGARFHGDLQGLENWTKEEDALKSLSRMNIEINFHCRPFSRVILSDNKKIKAKYSFKRPLCYLVKRGTDEDSLDQGLKKQAVELGVDVIFNQPISPDKADIITTGPDVKKIFAVARGLVFQTDFNDSMFVLLDDKLAFRGYSYLLISSGYACMCAVMFSKFNEVNESLQKTKAAFEKWIGIEIKNTKDVGGIGSFKFNNIYKNQTSLFAGESAGIQDILWGFGIRSAMESGFLAAQSILNGTDYVETAKKEFEGKQKAGIVNRFLYEQFGRLGYSFLIRLTKNLTDPLYYLHKAHKFTKIHKLIYPAALLYMRRRYPNLQL